MLPNDDLARWGEPPTNDDELVLADLLADVLHRLREAGEPGTKVPEGTGAPNQGANAPRSPVQTRGPIAGTDHELLETSDWIEDMVSSVLTHSGLFDNPPVPADAGGPAAAQSIDLRLRVLRVVGPLRYQPVASTHDRPTVLRDMRRVPDNPERVTLRTGDRVRLELSCDHDGYVTVLNVGPGGTVNLLYPESRGQLTPLRARTPLTIADVQMTPPAGKERLYAVWSRAPLAAAQITELIRPGVVLRDMQRVQEKLAELRPDEWHAVMLELEHVA
jgi:hypothetical protein